MQSNTGENRFTTYVNTQTEKLISPAALRLTEKILGCNSEELVEILHELAFELDLSHIGIVCFATNRSWDVSLLTSVITYSKSWQTRYFFRRYGEIDPVIKRGSAAVLPFDWADLEIEEPDTQRFFADAIRHGIGCRGLSIPVRGRKAKHSRCHIHVT
jgi:hypothetical protein